MILLLPRPFLWKAAALVVALLELDNGCSVWAFVIPITTITPRLSSVATKRTQLAQAIEKRLGGNNNTNNNNASPTPPPPKRIKSKRRYRFSELPQRAVKIYTDYASRLWNETNPEARKNIANGRAAASIRQVKQIIRGDSKVNDITREELIYACDDLLRAINKNATTTMSSSSTTSTSTEVSSSSPHILSPRPITAVMPITEFIKPQIVLEEEVQHAAVNNSVEKKKPRRSILFGAVMGFAVACWVFSGNYIFTGLFTLMTILGQLEYYRMIINTGVYPARRISVVGACCMFLSALFTPDLHQICLPLFGTWAMIWFLAMRSTPTTIAEVATTFTGMFYLGYVPSFWVRIRLIGANREPTRLASIAKPFLNLIHQKATSTLPPFLTQKAIHLPITTGAIFIFWTWLCLAFADVGAYFFGKNYGKTKLGRVSPAAGATSPNKTVEGVIGGCVVSGILGMLGAWVQKWPLWYLTGAVHGILLGFLGLIGDLTASMLKRDAGLKDFGDLIPEHGGIMDRVDSFIWTAPYSWLVCAYIIPALRAWVR